MTYVLKLCRVGALLITQWWIGLDDAVTHKAVQLEGKS